METNHNAKEIRILVSPTTDDATNVSGSKVLYSFPSIMFSDIFFLVCGKISAA